MKKNNADKGWIALHRSIRDNLVYKNSVALHVWIECLLRASSQDDNVYLGRQQISLKAGQFCMGRKEFGESIGVSATTAWFWVKKLKVDSRLDIQTTSFGTIVTVLNWSQYQRLDSDVDSKKTQTTIYNNMLITNVINKDATRLLVDLVLDKFMDHFGQLPIDKQPRNVAWNLIRNYKAYLKAIGETRELSEMIEIGFAAYKKKFPDMSVLRLETVRLFLKSVMETKVKNLSKTYDK